MIKVLLADDQELIRQSLSFVMSKQEDIEMVGTAANGCEALELVEEKQLFLQCLQKVYENLKDDMDEAEHCHNNNEGKE